MGIEGGGGAGAVLEEGFGREDEGEAQFAADVVGWGGRALGGGEREDGRAEGLGLLMLLWLVAKGWC